MHFSQIIRIIPHENVCITYFIHHFDHFLYFIGADVGAVSKAKIDEDPLSEEVLTLGGFVVVIDEWERTAQRRPTYRFGPLFFKHCEVQQTINK